MNHLPARPLLPLILACPLFASPQPNTECVPELSNLSFPPLARKARIQGSVRASLTVTPDGKVSDIEVSGFPLLAVHTQAALRTVQMAPGCSGRRTALTVQYTIDSSAEPDAPVATIRHSATAYEVTTPADMIEITTYDPAWLFSRRKRLLHKTRVFLSRLRPW